MSSYSFVGTLILRSFASLALPHNEQSLHRAMLETAQVFNQHYVVDTYILSIFFK